jgi:hypothetical protein
MVVVICSGSAIAFNDENVPAVIQAWYPGQRGDAVADVIFGNYNPAGRLPVTFYKSTSDLPPINDYAMYNRTYRYDTRPVMYPFGHGLSYSTFTYSGLTAPAKSGTGDDLKVAFTVKNTSTVDGDEVVQCYVNRELPPVNAANVPTPDKMSDEQATLLATPRKTLVGFARVPLKAGESKNVTFIITAQQLSLVVGKDGKREVRPGTLQIQVGGSSVIGPGTPTQALTLEGAPKAPDSFSLTDRRPHRRAIPARAPGGEADAIDRRVGGDEQGRAVLSPRHVADVPGHVDPAEQCPIGREGVHSARTHAEDVSRRVDLHSIGGAAPPREGGGPIEEDAAPAQGAIGVHLERHPHQPPGVGIGHVACAGQGRTRSRWGP